MRSLLPTSTAEPDLTHAYAVPEGTRHVRANFVVSLDGAIEVEGRSGGLGGAADKRVFRTLRSLADVVLVGAGTARAENYGPARLDADQRERRQAAGQLPVPPIAVITRRGFDAGARLFESDPYAPRPLLLTTAQTPLDHLQDRAEIVVTGDASVDLGQVFDELAARGLRRVLCEGGPSLLTALVDTGLLDELCLTLSPVLAGPDRSRLLSGAWTGPAKLHLTTVLEEDGFLFLRYSRPASSPSPPISSSSSATPSGEP